MAIIIQRLAARPRGSLFLLAAVLAGMCCGSAADAAPVAFRFDATVTELFSANPIDLPFTAEVGGVISGKLTFEPNTAVPIADNAIGADQFLGLEFSIDGVEFGSSTYRIQVINDTAFDDFEFEEPLDSMTIRCSTSSQSCTPDLISIPGGDAFAITTRFQLLGAGDILDTPSVSADAEVWNAFTIARSLALTFNSETGGSMSLRANVGQFSPVPEPTSLSLMLGTSIGGLLVWWTARRTRPAKMEKRLWELPFSARQLGGEGRVF